uniref:Uncharacterized protein n=1 Tax=Aegilops tauschii subsp. strangulata TaxID=200361 RepID=A0A453JXA6_AEGTS
INHYPFSSIGPVHSGSLAIVFVLVHSVVQQGYELHQHTPISACPEEDTTTHPNQTPPTHGLPPPSSPQPTKPLAPHKTPEPHTATPGPRLTDPTRQRPNEQQQKTPEATPSLPLSPRRAPPHSSGGSRGCPL